MVKGRECCRLHSAPTTSEWLPSQTSWFIVSLQLEICFLLFFSNERSKVWPLNYQTLLWPHCYVRTLEKNTLHLNVSCAALIRLSLPSDSLMKVENINLQNCTQTLESILLSLCMDEDADDGEKLRAAAGLSVFPPVHPNEAIKTNQSPDVRSRLWTSNSWTASACGVAAVGTLMFLDCDA